jgi:hypothetical protein
MKARLLTSCLGAGKALRRLSLTNLHSHLRGKMGPFTERQAVGG